MVIRRTLLIALGLVALTVVAFWRVGTAEFVDFDDPGYVFQNDIVLQGLTWRNVCWAFERVGQENNWHPLTWLSHMLDITLFGTNPLGHHLVNLALHVCNTLLLFALWNRMTGAVWSSAMVAALFAIHPLHVESVAWVAERKDMLSTLLGLLTLLAYLAYSRRPGIAKYSLVLVLFALGLMAKPMLVTLPCVMLLLDYWPLERLWKTQQSPPAPAQNVRAGKSTPQRRPVVRDRRRQIGLLVLEKLPLLALSGASSAITCIAQRKGGALASLDGISLGLRIENAVVAYGQYMLAMFWPANLAVFYPHKIRYPATWVMASATAMLLVTILVSYLALRGRRYPIVGWLWFLGTLVPVIGLVQVGDQAMADRYSYIPYIGLFVGLVWGAVELLAPRPLGRKILAAMAALILTACTVLTSFQLAYWQNTQALLERALHVSPDNPGAHTNLGAVDWEHADKDLESARRCEAEGKKNEAAQYQRVAKEKQDRAMEHWREAIRIQPRYADAYSNLGHGYATRGQVNEAAQCFLKAIEVIPRCTPARVNLGFLLLNQGKDAEAAKQFTEALEYEPDNFGACRGMAVFNIRQGKLDEAAKCYQKVLHLLPNDTSALNDLGVVRLRQGKPDDAIAIFQGLLQAAPDSPDVRTNLGAALFAQGHRREAIAQWHEVLRQQPDTAGTLQMLAWTLATHPDASIRNGAEAVVLAQRLVNVTGGRDAMTLDTLAAACAEAGKFQDAIVIARRVLQAAIAQGNSAVAAKMQARIELFQSGSAVRDLQTMPTAKPDGQ